jgi:protein tyrosine/serine phosphatase
MNFSRRSFFALAVLSPNMAFAREAQWARPLSLDGVPNLHQVGANLYRSAQPTARGFVALQTTYNVQTIINLRSSQTDAALINSSNMVEQSVPMNALLVHKVDVIAALKLIVAASANGPVLVHCKHGADRTGLVIAMYRILYQGWTKQQAIDELEHGGFGYHTIFFNIPIFIQNANIADYKRALAITE